MKYRREIDGLRSIAVLPVIFFHAGVSVFSGGYVGVDIFFVISGYLITTIIIAEKGAGTFTIANFYERRARRILPALFFVILACLPFAWQWMTPIQLKEFSNSVVAVSLFSSNILFWRESGYFAPAAELKPLLHTWSLAVEEQYYLFFPLYILATWRFGKNFVFISLLIVGGASLLLSQYGAENAPSANFYLLPTRLWELLVGSLIAIYLLGKNSEGSEMSLKANLSGQLLSALGLVLILYSVFAFDSETPFPSFYALIPIVGTGLIILYASGSTLVGKLLSNRVPVGIGLISYSAYLWHQPLFAFARLRSLHEPGHWLMASLGFLSLILAYLSWKYVEKPYRDKRRYNRKQIFRLAAFASLASICIGLAGYMSKGFPSRAFANGSTYADAEFDYRIRVNRGLSEACDGDSLLPADCRTSDEPEILVWGDSYAMHLVDGILASNSAAKIIQMTKPVCGPMLGLAPVSKEYPESWAEGCISFNKSVADWISENSSLRFAVLSSPFEHYLMDSWRIRDADGVKPPDASIVYQHLTATLDFLISQGIEPVVFAPPPTNGEDIGTCLVKASVLGYDLNNCKIRVSDYPEEYKLALRFLEQIDQKYHVIWFDEFSCEEGACLASLDDAFLYRDKGHFSYEGSAIIGEKMDFYRLIVTEVPVRSTHR
ncbi:acyltransferase family protein [Pseudohalioglobus lutimaris]|uniref:Acyltransferase n=1 Tax=Pseudohalioglobus lutimaris TaxID=1737061 RepID=A0A2N5X811_9GAMM|nr:acyltransferase family protein [Pseudohalioglobus lutimaris]PLW70612.1 acyltransferase [Pseudohalioglobus lutimaris]